jgi:hypothetical protein
MFFAIALVVILLIRIDGLNHKLGIYRVRRWDVLMRLEDGQATRSWSALTVSKHDVLISYRTF